MAINKTNTELEKTVAALCLCVPADALDAAMDEVNRSSAEESKTGDPRTVDVEDIILEVLTELGTPAHIKGHPYLVTALLLVNENPDLLHAVTKGLYFDIAKLHNTIGSRVERAIRHAIEVTWDRSDLDTLARYFGNIVQSAKGKPTNSEFVAQLYHVIRKRIKEARI